MLCVGVRMCFSNKFLRTESAYVLLIFPFHKLLFFILHVIINTFNFDTTVG